MKKVLYIILSILFVIVIAIDLLIIFNIPFFGIKLFRVGSGSMNPYLKINDIIVVKSQDEYQINDVITYKIKDNELITHRIVDINNNKVVTKGDANNIVDKPIKKKNIIGKVVFKTTSLGFIVFLFNKPIFWLLIFVIGVITTIIIPREKKM